MEKTEEKIMKTLSGSLLSIPKENEDPCILLTPKNSVSPRSSLVKVEGMANWKELVGIYEEFLLETKSNNDGVLQNPVSSDCCSLKNVMERRINNTPAICSTNATPEKSIPTRGKHDIPGSYACGDSLLSPALPRENTGLCSDGFYSPYPENCDLNSCASKTIAPSSTASLFQFAPITPDKADQLESFHHSEIDIFSADKTASSFHTDNQSAVISPLLKETEIDLNTTPEQKQPTRRRKHRPKVVTEAKPKRTPKSSSTPKQTRRSSSTPKKAPKSSSSPKNNTPKENTSSGKRKYTRKKTPSSEFTTSNADQVVKSCKRVLNFDLQNVAINEQKGSGRAVLQAHEQYNKNSIQTNTSEGNNVQMMTDMDKTMVNRGLKRDLHTFKMSHAEGTNLEGDIMEICSATHKKKKFEEPACPNAGVEAENASHKLTKTDCQKAQDADIHYWNTNSATLSDFEHEQGKEQRTSRTKVSVKRRKVRWTQSNIQESRLSRKRIPKEKNNVLGAQRGQDNTVSIDILAFRLKCLVISDKRNSNLDIGKQQGALVPYIGDGALVPFEAFDLSKSRKPRPKVDLDPETCRLWDLLMGGKEGSESEETVDKDKEKWWEEEQEVFRGRANSLIARMHLVQGDRRFSRWKGSVVDSVIGVFLTQNVSDHLSSSAFMSLAAKFPQQSVINKREYEQNGVIAEIKETEVQVIDPDGTITYQKSTLKQLSNEKNKRMEDEFNLLQNYSLSSFLQEIKSSSGSKSYTEDQLLSGNQQLQNQVSSQESFTMGTCIESSFVTSRSSWLVTKQFLETKETTSDYARTAQNCSGLECTVPGIPQDAFLKRKADHLENLQPHYPTGSIYHFPPSGQLDYSSNGSSVTVEASSEQQSEGKIRPDKQTTKKANNVSNTMKKKSEGETKMFDWDSLRRDVKYKSERIERNKYTMDSLDYEALRRAEVNEIADVIKERGMNNRLADRIKDFLNRLVRDHGSTDLEWLRHIEPDKAKEYLLSIRGLGLKSVECVRLLTLHHLAFPVDTNVGRIAVRLGWVPLKPLPESLQLHLLELYPVLESIQKYLWPRLCKLDQKTLYELHYQMITFGKVFCTKRKPNCNACPMRAECRHFASAFASVRLALPGPKERSMMSSTAPISANANHSALFNPNPSLLCGRPEVITNLNREAAVGSITDNCEPIIEEPATPEPFPEISECDIEDAAFYNDGDDEIPTIKLNIEEFTTNLQNILQEKKGMEESDISKALVSVNPEVAFIPTPKLKNVSRLRTEHQVYELPDSHPLLERMDRREPDDPSPYLLAIWAPGETANSIQSPQTVCDSQGSGTLCKESTCYSCSIVKENDSQTVRGTLLIPCRTAMKGSFPLNGTYFQVNELFADHESSLSPIDVPRRLIWYLPRRTVYFGTTVTTIFKGLSTDQIQHCFWRGFVCVRGFDRKTRAPRPLIARLHFTASRMVKYNKDKSVNKRNKGSNPDK
ncbi:unnamed protein product [Cuscuta epithymum]|uniref:HhH-GPD domain-containing protein n=1 Tax=Cuscuta epithymum TaxID=186058 RepID=A0AAV0D639_9ASTE|nr:unnamed protein product [Cuscuta epithymum]